jgi:hypothetical protein
MALNDASRNWLNLQSFLCAEKKQLEKVDTKDQHFVKKNLFRKKSNHQTLREETEKGVLKASYKTGDILNAGNPYCTVLWLLIYVLA